ncbi:uncharacterized protein Dere_GG26200 [Drosophila erecta]|uniref:Uncharacterized protein n=1 Tax=Drosophila erecta TaxID=7220 RepID=A0A0Q5T5K0_DROER|nr:uncharacterized protein Dere_GG26200 [Drosophila erecta]
MGRSKVIRKKQLRRHSVKQENTEDYYLTPDEVQESVERWSFLWQYTPDCDSETEGSSTSTVTQQDPTAYGDWCLPGGEFDFQTTGKEMLMNLSKFPYPDLIHPPVLLDTKLPNTLRVNRRPYITHKIFEYVMPDIYNRAKEIMEPPVCEGAVGYDPMYFDPPMLIKPLCKYSKHPYFSATWNNTSEESWMNWRRCAKMLLELNESLVDYEKLPRGPKNCQYRRNKLLSGLGKDPERCTRWLRPRTRFTLNPEPDAIDKQWEGLEEEQLASDDLYADIGNEELETDTQPSCNASVSDDLIPRITQSQSDINRDYLRTSLIIRRCHSLNSILHQDHWLDLDVDRALFVVLDLDSDLESQPVCVLFRA